MPFRILRVVPVAAAFFFLTFSTAALCAERQPFRVFLDPAHGGADTGAIGQDVAIEKNITLKLAQAVRAKLAASKNIEVVMARTDDAEIKPLDRIAMANGSKAALYLGIHAAGSERTAAHERKIFISAKMEGGQPGGGEIGNWSAVNARYYDKSKAFAKSLAENMKVAGPRGKNGIMETDGLFLDGLNMPAALIEAVDMADPTGALAAADDKNIARIAGAIAEAVKEAAEAAANK